MRVLVTAGAAHLLRPTVRSVELTERLRNLAPMLRPAPAESVRFVLCRTPGSFSRWLRRHPARVGELIEEGLR